MFGMFVGVSATYNKGCFKESSLCESFNKKLCMPKYRRHATCQKMSASEQWRLITVSIADGDLHCNQTTDLSFQVHVSLGVGGLPWQEKGCSEVKSIFVSVWRGLTCIQVELYESEGQSYELCRSGKKKNPADNKKTDSSSTALLLQQCYTGLHKLRSKQTKLIYKCALQWFYSYLMNVTHHECRASNTMLRMSLQSFLLSNIMKTKAGLNSRFVSLSLSVRCCQIMIQSDLFACKAVCCRFSNKGFVCCQLRTKLKQVSGKLQSSR